MRRELERTRDLLSVVDEATSQLSLAHTLETAVVRAAEPARRAASVGIYLRSDGRLETAASCEVTGPHSVVAERLLELALGPFRARGFVAATDARADRHLVPVRAARRGGGDRGRARRPARRARRRDRPPCRLPAAGRALTDDQSALLAALAAQIAVAVQNARPARGA